MYILACVGVVFELNEGYNVFDFNGEVALSALDGPRDGDIITNGRRYAQHFSALGGWYPAGTIVGPVVYRATRSINLTASPSPAPRPALNATEPEFAAVRVDVVGDVTCTCSQHDDVAGVQPLRTPFEAIGPPLLGPAIFVGIFVGTMSVSDGIDDLPMILSLPFAPPDAPPPEPLPIPPPLPIPTLPPFVPQFVSPPASSSPLSPPPSPPPIISGCTYSTGSNYNPSASAEDGSCIFVRSSSTVTGFGYWTGCKLFYDTDGDHVHGLGDSITVDTTDATGYGSVVVREERPGRVFVDLDPEACTNSVNGGAFLTPERGLMYTLYGKRMVTPLTTVLTLVMENKSTALEDGRRMTCDLLLSDYACVGQCSSLLPSCRQGVDQYDVLHEYHQDQWKDFLLVWLFVEFAVIKQVACTSDLLQNTSCTNCFARSRDGTPHSAHDVYHALYRTLADYAIRGDIAYPESPAYLARLANDAAEALNLAARVDASATLNCSRMISRTWALLVPAQHIRG